jgi:hypothetical protein
VTVQTLHVLSNPTDSQSADVTIAALSKNLRGKEQYYYLAKWRNTTGQTIGALITSLND